MVVVVSGRGRGGRGGGGGGGIGRSLHPNEQFSSSAAPQALTCHLATSHRGPRGLSPLLTSVVFSSWRWNPGAVGIFACHFTCYQMRTKTKCCLRLLILASGVGHVRCGDDGFPREMAPV